jgi:hypothetical protein
LLRASTIAAATAELLPWAMKATWRSSAARSMASDSSLAPLPS